MPCGCGAGIWLCLPWEEGRRGLEMEREGTALETGLTALAAQSDERAWGQSPGRPCPQLPLSATPWHRQRRDKTTAVLPRKENSCPRQWLFLCLLRMSAWTDTPARAHIKLQGELGPVESLAAQALHGCDPTHTPGKRRRQRASPCLWVYLGMQHPPQRMRFPPPYHHTIWVDSNIHAASPDGAPPAYSITVIWAQVPSSRVSLDEFTWTAVAPLNFSAGIRNWLRWPAQSMHPGAAGDVVGTSVLWSTHVPGEMPLSPLFLTWISHVAPPGAQQRNLARCFNFLVFTALIALD